MSAEKSEDVAVIKSESEDLAHEKSSWLMYPIKKLSDIFVPIIPAIIAGAMLIAVNKCLTIPFFNGQTATLVEKYPEYSAIFDMLHTFANAPFIFLPILVAFSATRAFGGNPFLGATLGMIMVHPDLLSFSGFTNAEEPIYWQFFDGERLAVGDFIVADSYVAQIGYQGTIIPVLIMSWVLAKLEYIFDKIIPRFLDVFLVPLLALFITATITFVSIPPILRQISSILDVSTMPFGVYTPYINGFLVCAIGLVSYKLTSRAKVKKAEISRYPVESEIETLVTESDETVTEGEGVEQEKEALENQAVENIGAENVDAEKETLIPVSTSVANLASDDTTSTDTLMTHDTETSTTDAVTFTGLTGNSEDTLDKQEENVADNAMATDDTDTIAQEWVMPLEGNIVALADIPDTAFASGAMGAGFGIKPHATMDTGKVVSPVSGVISAIFPTKHAICIDTDDGVEILIHVGIDTVTLNGEGFTLLVKEGTRVASGTPLLEVDWKLINDKELSDITPILFTSMDDGEEIEIKNGIPVLVA